jgi:hypothetical protein
VSPGAGREGLTTTPSRGGLDNHLESVTQVRLECRPNMKITRILVAVILAAVALLTIASCSSYGKKLAFNGGELYYTSQVTETEANKLGEYLVKEKFFDGTRKTVQLNKSGGTYEFRMVVLRDAEKERGAAKQFSAVSRELSENVFNGGKVAVHLCDDHLKTLLVVGGN